MSFIVKVIRDRKGVEKMAKNWRDICISPEYPYCPDCPHGHLAYSEDDEEFVMLNGSVEGTNPEWLCDLEGGEKREIV